MMEKIIVEVYDYFKKRSISRIFSCEIMVVGMPDTLLVGLPENLYFYGKIEAFQEPTHMGGSAG